MSPWSTAVVPRVLAPLLVTKERSESTAITITRILRSKEAGSLNTVPVPGNGICRPRADESNSSAEQLIVIGSLCGKF